MTLKSFLKLVELPTKVASLFPFLIGTSYAVYHFRAFNFINFAMMFVAMIALDMATTALNNYMDNKKAVKTHGFNYEEHNAIVKYGIGQKTVVRTILVLACIATVLGVFLYLRTNIVVLLLGMISFFFAGIYTWGPVPISRTPLGEVVSGSIMGGVITFISIYIHVYDTDLIVILLNESNLNISINYMEMIAIILVALPLIAGIANIMLANNTCDMEDDFVNRRFTLPLLIGKENALKLFSGLYFTGYLSITFAVLAGWLPLTCLLVLFTVVPVRKNIQKFKAKQTKAETFIISVQNFMMISAVYLIGLLAGFILL